MLYGEIGTLASGVVAETALAADTETKIESYTAPYDITIKELQVTFANVVDAKAATGYLEIKSSLGKTPQRFPIGYGAGGAATTPAKRKASFDVNIPVQANEVLDFYATMNEAAVSAFVGFKFVKGASGRSSWADCNTAEDAAVSADTKTSFSTITIPPGKGGTIKEIIVAFANVVDAKAATGYVDLESNVSKGGPHRYIIGGGSGGATNAGHDCDPIHIPVNIPVKQNEILTPNLYLAEAAVNAHVGIIWT